MMQYLSINSKVDPARLLFLTSAGPAVVASIMDLGSRFCLLVNVVDTIEQSLPLPKLPVARYLVCPVIAGGRGASLLISGTM